METLNREDILRMIGLRDAAGLYGKVNSLMIDMYDEGGKLAEYSTQILQTEKNITLLAQRVTDDETNIADLTVQAKQITASVSSLTTTVNGHEQRIGELVIKDNEITQRVTVIEGDYVKNAQISLMVTKDGDGYISNALVKADDITFVFTDAVTWYWQQQAEANKRMGLDDEGNLWISGQYRGGTITDNVVVGTSGGKMEIYSDEVVTGSLKKSGLRGVVSSNTVLDLGFTQLNSELSPYFWMHGTAPFIVRPATLTMHPYSMSIGIDSGNAIRIGIGPTGKIDVAVSSASAWPSSRDEVGIGGIFVEDNEIMRVRLS